VPIRLPVRVAEGKDAKVRLGKARLDGLVPRGIRVFSETIRVSWMSRSEDKKGNRRPLGHIRSRPKGPAEARSDANARCFGWDSPRAVHEASRPVRRMACSSSVAGERRKTFGERTPSGRQMYFKPRLHACKQAVHPSPVRPAQARARPNRRSEAQWM
jgi:hypothetical protein